MSQISSVVLGNPPFAGPILSLTPNINLNFPHEPADPVGPDINGNINILGDSSSFIDVIGSPGASTLIISLINQKAGTASTTNNTPKIMTDLDLDISTLPTVGRAYAVNVTFVGVKNDYTAAVTGTASVSAIVDTLGVGGITQPAITYTRTVDIDFFPSVTFQITGTTLQFVVIGEPFTNMNWSAVLTYIFA